MHPLSLDVWIYIVVAYFIVSLLLFILARYTEQILVQMLMDASGLKLIITNLLCGRSHPVLFEPFPV